MAEKWNQTAGGVSTEPDTEEEWLTDSEADESEALYPVSRRNVRVSLVSSVPIKSGTKPKLWLKQARDERVRREEERREHKARKEFVPRKKLLKKKAVVSKND